MGTFESNSRPAERFVAIRENERSETRLMKETPIMHPKMDPAEVLASDEALETFERVLREASQPPEEHSEPEG